MPDHPPGKNCRECDRHLPAKMYYRYKGKNGWWKLSGLCKECTGKDRKERYAKRKKRLHMEEGI